MDIYKKCGVLQGWLREGNLKMRRKLPFWEAWFLLLSKVGILPTCGGWKSPLHYDKERKAES